MNCLASALFLLAQQDYSEFDASHAAEPTRQINLLQWAFQSLGFFYTVTILGSGFLIFVGALLVVSLARRPSVAAAYLVFVPTPLLFGILGTFDGFIHSLSVIATAGGSPEPAAIAEGISTACFSSLAGIFFMLPSFFVVAIGLFVRTLLWQPPRGDKSA